MRRETQREIETELANIQEVFTAFSLKNILKWTPGPSRQVAKGHDVGDGEGGDWKPRCICRRMQSFGMGVVEGKRELTCSHQLPHRQSLELELRREGRGREGAWRRNPTFETFSKSHPPKGSSLL